ncbi:hypothetical protein FVE85_3245 [Porphyridium purpureum]|uniref:Uncharacterized protein n=1 Tax=Porphyridium purpureum TaxID=35688 RepID=A0A5J4YW97_PORPP|nr:hypothetical protein FVE85_3245 [Porphyridium purpureum]|eukprot:POR1228..scf227_4
MSDGQKTKSAVHPVHSREARQEEERTRLQHEQQLQQNQQQQQQPQNEPDAPKNIFQGFGDVFKNVGDAFQEVVERLQRAEKRREDWEQQRQWRLEDDAEPVGTLNVALLGSLRLSGRVRVQMRLNDISGSRHQRTTLIFSKVFDWEHRPDASNRAAVFISLPVRDIVAQLDIRVFEIPPVPLIPPKYMGAVIVPLRNLVYQQEQDVWQRTKNSFGRFVFSQSAWYQLFPLAEQQTFYSAVVEDLADLGMDHHPKLPAIELKLDLEFSENIGKRYMYGFLQSDARCLRDVSPPDYKWYELVRNVFRVRDAWESSVSLTRVMNRAKRWNSPLLSFGVGLYIFSLCHVPFVLIPLVLVLTTATVEFLEFKRTMRKQKSRAKPWKHQMILPPDKSKTAIGEALKWQQGLSVAQCYLDRLATLMECSRNALNWTDPAITIISYSVLIVLCIVFAVTTTLMYRYTATRFWVALALSTWAILPEVADEDNPGGDSSPSMPRSHSVRELSTLTQNQFKARVERFVGRVALRIPSDRDLLHNLVCEQQMVLDPQTSSAAGASAAAERASSRALASPSKSL